MGLRTHPLSALEAHVLDLLGAFHRPLAGLAGNSSGGHGGETEERTHAMFFLGTWVSSRWSAIWLPSVKQKAVPSSDGKQAGFQACFGPFHIYFQMTMCSMSEI